MLSGPDIHLAHTTMKPVTPSSADCSDSARYWRTPAIPEIELLAARYRRLELAPHWHDTFVIPVVETGIQSYDYDGKKYLAGPGQIAAINPGLSHTAKSALAGGWSYRAFYPSADYMRRLADGMRDGQAAVPWLPLPTIVDPSLAAALLYAHQRLQTSADPLQAETAVLRAFALLLTRYAGIQPEARLAAPNTRRVAIMQERLAERLDAAVTLNELAEAVGLSPFYAAQLFTRQVGMPPHAWRNQLRLHRARAMMRRSASVTEAALACGFSDQSHFTRHFKKAYGVSPGKWKDA